MGSYATSGTYRCLRAANSASGGPAGRAQRSCYEAGPCAVSREGPGVSSGETKGAASAPSTICSSVPKSFPTLCDPMDGSTPGFPAFTIS